MKKMRNVFASLLVSVIIPLGGYAQSTELGLTLGTEGVGLDLSVPVVKKWVGIRTGFSFMPHFNATMHFGFEGGDESMTQEEKDQH